MVENAENRGELLAADAFRRNEFPPSEWVHIWPKNSDAWGIFSSAEQNILAKIEKAAPQLKMDVDVSFGIKTGYNALLLLMKASS